MARSRLLKPGFFLSEELGRLSFAHRLAFAGLWTIADRAGRLDDRPTRIRVELFPYDVEPPCPHCRGRGLDLNEVLNDLHRGDFLTRYIAPTGPAIAIRSFLRHQSIHPREAPSIIDPPPRNRPEIAKPLPSREKDGTSRGTSTSTSTSVSTSASTSAAVPREDARAEEAAAAAGKNKVPDVNGRSRHPIFKGQRIVVFDWQLEDLIRLLGTHADEFDLHAWFYQLDAQTGGIVLAADREQRWAWLQRELVAEARRRGLPVADVSTNAALDDAVWSAIIREGPGSR
jgi:hypothetical protein